MLFQERVLVRLNEKRLGTYIACGIALLYLESSLVFTSVKHSRELLLVSWLVFVVPYDSCQCSRVRLFLLDRLLVF